MSPTGRVHRVVDSPVGPLTLVWDPAAGSDRDGADRDGADRDGGALAGCWVHDQRERPSSPEFGVPGSHPGLDAAAAQLAEYFAGTRRDFDVPLVPGSTPFGRDVAAALRAVPYGATTSYGELAAAVGRPKAAQAVGTANARNPLSFFVPCHRVVPAGGAVVGEDEGARRKRWLQALERDLDG